MSIIQNSEYTNLKYKVKSSKITQYGSWQFKNWPKTEKKKQKNIESKVKSTHSK